MKREAFNAAKEIDQAINQITSDANQIDRIVQQNKDRGVDVIPGSAFKEALDKRVKELQAEFAKL